MDLNYDESRTGSLRVFSLAMFVIDFSTIVSGFKPRPFLYRIDLINNESQKGSIRVHSLAVFITDLSTIVTGVVAPHHHLTVIPLLVHICATFINKLHASLIIFYLLSSDNF